MIIQSVFPLKQQIRVHQLAQLTLFITILTTITNDIDTSCMLIEPNDKASADTNLQLQTASSA